MLLQNFHVILQGEKTSLKTDGKSQSFIEYCLF